MMGALKPSIICSKPCRTRAFDSSSLTIGWGALKLTTQARKILFQAKKGILSPFSGKKCVFFP